MKKCEKRQNRKTIQFKTFTDLYHFLDNNRTKHLKTSLNSYLKGLEL